MVGLKISAPNSITSTKIQVSVTGVIPFESLDFTYTSEGKEVWIHFTSLCNMTKMTKLEFLDLVVSLNAMADDIKKCEDGTL